MLVRLCQSSIHGVWFKEVDNIPPLRFSSFVLFQRERHKRAAFLNIWFGFRRGSGRFFGKSGENSLSRLLIECSEDDKIFLKHFHFSGIFGESCASDYSHISCRLHHSVTALLWCVSHDTVAAAALWCGLLAPCCHQRNTRREPVGHVYNRATNAILCVLHFKRSLRSPHLWHTQKIHSGTSLTFTKHYRQNTHALW